MTDDTFLVSKHLFRRVTKPWRILLMTFEVLNLHCFILVRLLCRKSLKDFKISGDNKRFLKYNICMVKLSKLWPEGMEEFIQVCKLVIGGFKGSLGEYQSD